ncbi:protein of unknown function [Taphrina deformans PYCC 5710]|uniref:Kynurenine 3-monooxygenase n=1 Tax=Taphrina deformans (strain PYCC 5710 / ATCC 11124 / CBS 356.35 / IMI 108563 / JCM 9778 / NBRC 8474) TaxID=1097556 RepID=R4XM66_TAPDE|nr:protein of unknown function [Taphrina deformans PYCC 5710]|eukprot:CCG84390.1 protein of unknown function [Taphrina deformans PYCC 5710]
MSDIHIAIVGAGLVGSLAAISFSRQGYRVSVFESRPDPRHAGNTAGRSINLAVSARGLGAIRSIDPDLCDKIIRSSIPMKGRMIHVDGAQQSQIYGLFGECINSIDRSQLNLDLINEAETSTGVSFFFNHKLLSADFVSHKLRFGVTGQQHETEEIQADLTVGCDGAYSAVRKAMMKSQRMDFSQEYVEHAYLELSILPSEDGDYRLDKEHLHIWPRQEFMLIALPNPDKSFTSTLFAPFTLFNSLKTSQDVVQFFRSQFPDALEMIGEGRLIHIWEHNPVSPLIQIKCTPYHFGDSAILLGDATHAMVPFYGQGMNCGFEDIRVLNTLLQKHNISPDSFVNIDKALTGYTTCRHEDLLAILKLAMGNYVEMRSSVTSKLYLIRKRLDGILGRLFRDRWVPMYSMVSFRDDLRYSDVIKRQKRQDKIVEVILTATSSIAGLGLLSLIFTHYQSSWRLLLRKTLSQILRYL